MNGQATLHAQQRLELDMAARKQKAGGKYGDKAEEKVGRALHEMKRGTLKSGSTGAKVKSRKQAIAIGLSEARQAGGKVPRKRAKASKTSNKTKAKAKSKSKSRS
ncbi:MAG: DUF6496 domain-containing protein [Steroidobacteraceae bacterium]